jgi:hypothetical protein
MSQETIERTFTVQGSARLRLSNIRGSVIIRPSETGQVQIIAVKHLDSGKAERTQVEIAQAEDGSVVAETRGRENGLNWFGFSRPCKVDYTVSLPQGSNLDVNCVSSTMLVEDLQGEFDLDTVSGEMQINRLSGPLKINTVSAKVVGEGLSGDLKLSTVSGGVHLRASDLPSVKISTVSGLVELDTPLGRGPYRFNSVSGDIHLVSPPETHCAVHLSAVSGRLHTGLPLTSSQHHGGAQQAEIQGGGVDVHLSSVSGGLWVGPAGAAEVVGTREAPQIPQPPVPTAPPAPPPQAALSQSEILQQIERGEITVEEAVQLLRGK